MSGITSLTGGNFEAEVLNGEGVYVVRFWATWCGPCRMMEPVFRNVAKELGSEAGFGEVDVDRASEVAGAYGIRGVPTVIVFKDGQPAEQLVGIAPKGEYVAAVRRQLGA